MLRNYRGRDDLPQIDLPPQFSHHYLMGLDHRCAIAAAVPEGGKMLEWGSGNSTAWFRANLPDATVVSVEHHPKWAERVGSDRHFPVDVGRNATIGEERWKGNITPYITTAHDGAPWDVILVDGVLRNLCMLSSVPYLNPVGVLFLHDSQRDWYGAGKAGFVTALVAKSCADYPGPELWAGYPSLPQHRPH